MKTVNNTVQGRSRTELEIQLGAPGGAQLRDKYLTQLHALAARIHTTLSRGVSPNDYAAGRALAQAVATAVAILEEYPTPTEGSSLLRSAPSAGHSLPPVKP